MKTVIQPYKIVI